MAYPGSGADTPPYDGGHRMQDVPHAAVSKPRENGKSAIVKLTAEW